jgi:hypothetical protein
MYIFLLIFACYLHGGKERKANSVYIHKKYPSFESSRLLSVGSSDKPKPGQLLLKLHLAPK